MGRGRAKAKQTKVARELKYNSGGTDLERLKAELASGGGPLAPRDEPAEEVEDEFDDPYATDEDDEEDDLAAK